MAKRKNNVLSLRGAAPPVPQRNDAVVETLMELLAKAKDGRIVGFAYVAVEPEGHMSRDWCGTADAGRMVAGVHLLAHGITSAWWLA